MNTRKEFAAIDYFRLAASFMIVAIHTGPLEDFSEIADFMVTYCLGRIAVPFFLMVTGYFVLNGSFRKLTRYLCRFLLMYAGVTILYLPFTIYAGNLPQGPGGWLKWLLMDGTFYHLWYLPAALLGCVITAALLKYCPIAAGGILAALLYVAGLMGDSYYGLVAQVQPLENVYGFLFRISSYTRNGIFFAPVFLWMGAVLGRSGNGEKKSLLEGKRQKTMTWAAFGVCLALMLAEGYFTWSMGLQKHNSMYLFLLPVSFLLFKGLLQAGGKAPAVLRSLSMWIYLLHPLCIIGIRGVAKVLGLQAALVDQSLVFYAAVCVSSLITAVMLEWLRGMRRMLVAGRRQKKQEACSGKSTSQDAELPLVEGTEEYEGPEESDSGECFEEYDLFEKCDGLNEEEYRGVSPEEYVWLENDLDK